MIVRPRVLFVCVHNAGRSRMAEAWFNHLASDRYEGISAGTEPASAPHPQVVDSMRSQGLSVEGPGRLLTPKLAESAERVIGMGCNVQEACPALTTALQDWELPDPKGMTPEQVDALSYRIKELVEGLIAEMDAERGGG